MISSNTLNRMASYDFKAPIDVVCFEEENSSEQIDLTSSPDVQEDQVINNNKVTKDKIDIDIKIGDTPHEKQLNISNTKGKRKRKSVDGRTSNEKRKVSQKNPSKKANTDQSETNFEYINDHLKIVSKYLTLIMESYNYYMYILNNKKSSIHDVSLSKNSFLSTKYHFFNAAYPYVNVFIIPNETDQSFTQKFLNYTSNMARERIKTDCHMVIREIYFEMIEWVRSKQNSNLHDSSNTSVLRRHLNNPPIISASKSIETAMDVQQYPSNANQTKLCIFSSGPLGRQISINIDESLMSSKNQHQNNNNNLLQNTVGLEQNQRISQHNELPRNGNVSQNTNENRHIYPESESRIPQYQPSQNYLRNVVNENNQVYHNSHTNAFVNYYQTTNNYQNINYGPNSIIHRTPQIHPHNVINQDLNLRTFRKDYHDPTRQNIRGPPPPYNSPVVGHPNQIAHILQGPVVTPDFSSGPDLTRSSVSTDSGFISPIGSKSSSNPIEDIMNDLLELESTVQTQKSRAAPVICHVCQKKSTLMCSACFTTNYCSTKCQRVDWEAHQIVCK